jgi:hypothetical protein
LDVELGYGNGLDGVAADCRFIMMTMIRSRAFVMLMSIRRSMGSGLFGVSMRNERFDVTVIDRQEKCQGGEAGSPRQESVSIISFSLFYHLFTCSLIRIR